MQINEQAVAGVFIAGSFTAVPMGFVYILVMAAHAAPQVQGCPHKESITALLYIFSACLVISNIKITTIIAGIFECL